MKRLRVPAVPLITVDPYFSIWSFNDKLYGDVTRHWTGTRQNMLGIITVDGEKLRFMGKVQLDLRYLREVPVIEQTDVNVLPLRTEYIFKNEKICLKVTFMTPLLLEDLLIASRPVSYISYEVTSMDGKEHDIEIYFDINSEAAVNTPDQTLIVTKYENGAYCGRGEKDILSVSGDDQRIDWGYLHIFSKDHRVTVRELDSVASEFAFRGRYAGEIKEFESEEQFAVRDKFVSMGLKKKFTIGTSSYKNFICVAYDDIHSIQYFDKQIDAYYKKNGDTFDDVCKKALDEYNEINDRVTKFEAYLLAKAEKISKKYADIISLAYRQAVSAHKITWDGEEIQFFSKECYSNGCIGTVDVTYPSIPLFLIYNPELVFGMLNPIFKYERMELWPFEFAPHDVGQYPLATGQVYSYDRVNKVMSPDDQMPIEECGNMLIAVAAACTAQNSFEYLEKHFDTLTKWAEYLKRYGFDPENQLCTDDFAGHLAHNSNLSVKAIMGIACYGYMLNKVRSGEGDKYIEIAKKYAKQWKVVSFENDHYKLAFDQKNTWSIKYNLVWDKILGLGIFDEDIFETECKYYLTKLNKYGLPLDSRKGYSKTDWQMWSTRLTDNEEYSKEIIDRMWDWLNETPDRAPFGDWIETEAPHQIMFQARSVQGGLFINLL